MSYDRREFRASGKAPGCGRSTYFLGEGSRVNTCRKGAGKGCLDKRAGSASNSPAKLPKWKQQSAQLRAAMLAARPDKLAKAAAAVPGAVETLDVRPLSSSSMAVINPPPLPPKTPPTPSPFPSCPQPPNYLSTHLIEGEQLLAPLSKTTLFLSNGRYKGGRQSLGIMLVAR